MCVFDVYIDHRSRSAIPNQMKDWFSLRRELIWESVHQSGPVKDGRQTRSGTDVHG
jgi:hypothetical protein